MENVEYKFTIVKKPLLTYWTARSILKAYNSGLKSLKITLDLGLTYEEVYINGERVKIRNNTISINLLNKVKDDYVYIVQDDKLIKIAFYDKGNYYKLKALGETIAPTVEINGIHMHRIKDTTPMDDAESKVKAARVSRCHRVLDICTGLGYTAIKSLDRGACEIVSVEKDINILKIAELNPWSWRLSDKRIRIYLADASELIKHFPTEYFDRIIHDPPRFSLAGELYSEEFYKQLYRVLKNGGILYHYTGEPGRVRGKSILQGIISRLRRVGFYVQKYSTILGVVAFKEA